jgi:hypothetical protein
MRAADFAALPGAVRKAILDAWMEEESQSTGVDPSRILAHSEECRECRAQLIHRLEVFLAVNVDAVLVELMPSQSNPWLN